MAEKKAEKKESKVAYVVASPFNDKDDFSKSYAKGEDVSHFDEGRLADLVERKLVKVSE